ncbi:hypothetical protein [Mangrovimonas cancribranchiae]|uniref:PH domain-containing protein n=1 Tax=Mangrovimonas cancribranchiae TaxID=3080055 RepID=A0AAU6NWU6_9FLAO
MTFPFKKSKKRFYFNLSLGILWIIVGSIGVFMDDTRWTDYIFLIIGLFYLVSSFLDTQTHHLIITKDVIKEDFFFGKSINIKNINNISEFAGDIILKTPSKELTIHKQAFENEVFSSIKQQVERLKLDLN